MMQEGYIRDLFNKYQELEEKQAQSYHETIEQIQDSYNEIIAENTGKEILENCAKDLAGELVRNYFNFSEYHITIDQMFNRIINFSYDNPSGDDPLAKRESIVKENYNQYLFVGKEVSTFNKISEDMISENDKLFKKIADSNGKKRYKDQSLIEKGKKQYRSAHTNAVGVEMDEYTGREGTKTTNKIGREVSNLQVDHDLTLAKAAYNTRYITSEGIEDLKQFYNSKDNFHMMGNTANNVKSDNEILKTKDGRLLCTSKEKKEEKTRIRERLKENGDPFDDKSVNEVFQNEVKDISLTASPKENAEAVCRRFEAQSGESRQKLIDSGYLTEDGKVLASIKKKLENNYKHAENIKSLRILKKDVDYKVVASDSVGYLLGGEVVTTKDDDSDKLTSKMMFSAKGIASSPLMKIIAGQIIYYAVPPLIYEIRQTISTKKEADSEDLLSRIRESSGRITNYVVDNIGSMIGESFSNISKELIRSFMDILLNMIQATVKKMLDLIKHLLMSTVDAIKIITNANSSPEEKADAVANLYAITITNLVVDTLFELIGQGAHIPAQFLEPLQLITSVICTNLVLVVLKKADLFGVQRGFRLDKIDELFDSSIQKLKDEQTELIYDIDYTGEQMLLCLKESTSQLEVQLNSYEGRKAHIDMWNLGIDLEESHNLFLQH